jgi:hypothetical protein
MMKRKTTYSGKHVLREKSRNRAILLIALVFLTFQSYSFLSPKSNSIGIIQQEFDALKSLSEPFCKQPATMGENDRRVSTSVENEGSRLHITVCNGFANQRITLLSGIILALEMKRVFVLPDLILDGTQNTGDNVDESSTGHVPFR